MCRQEGLDEPTTGGWGEAGEGAECTGFVLINPQWLDLTLKAFPRRCLDFKKLFVIGTIYQVDRAGAPINKLTYQISSLPC